MLLITGLPASFAFKIIPILAVTVSTASVPGSVAFVPSAAGLIIAGEVVKDLAG